MPVKKIQIKYILIGVQILILLLAAGSWLINRSRAYSRVFTIEDYHLSKEAVIEDDISVKGTGSEGGVFLSTPPLRLDRGIYHIQIDYSADYAGSSASVVSGLSSLEMHCSPIELSPASLSALLPLEITRDTDDLIIEISFSGQGHLSIAKIGIFETSDLYKKNLFRAFLLCILINFGWFFKCSEIRQRKIILALSGIFLVSCYPLYNDYLTAGHDLPFHLLRIEAISQGLSFGSFPVKLHPLWANGHGYAVGIFYGDAFLYFPAFLRLLGFSIQSAYKMFVALINLGTILCSYYAFRKMFSSKKSGLIGCIAYTLAPYRLMDLYTRASVGEYTAMMVLPLILCGFYMIFHYSKEKFWWKASLLTAFGLTGLIQSHVLSGLMVGFVIILSCILLFRQVFRRHTFRALLSAAGLTILLNLNFTVPFLDFYQEDIMVNSPDWTGRAAGSFQAGGMFPVQLFTLFQKSNGGAWSVLAGVSNEATYGIGILLTIGILLFVYLLCIRRQDCRGVQNYRAAFVSMLLSVLLLYMCTCYFPWDRLASMGKGMDNIISSLQFPWRFLAPATVLLTFVLCYGFDMADRLFSEKAVLLLTGCMVLFAVNVGWYFYDFAFSGDPYRVYDTHELYTMQMYSYDYLPEGTDPDEIRENAVQCVNTAPLEAYRKQGTTIDCIVSADQKGGYVEFPLIYYKYYRCTDMDTGEALAVSAGWNNTVRVTLPAGYSGHIEIRFAEPWFWRLAEAVSFLTFVGAVIALFLHSSARERLTVRFLHSPSRER